MVASVLSTSQAIEASVLVVRTFVQLRRMLATSSEVSERLCPVENRLIQHDQKIANPAIRPKRRIGFDPVGSKMEC